MTALAGSVNNQQAYFESSDAGPRESADSKGAKHARTIAGLPPTLGVKPSTRWEELTPGLLVFFARPSRLQSWVERWGQSWRHVGITVQTPDGLRVASYSAKNCYRIDDLEDLMPNYDRIGVASIGATSAEMEVLSAWCASFENLARKDAPYTKSVFAIGPLLVIARRKTGLARALLLAVLLIYCQFEQLLARRRPAFVCSTFAWQAIVECTDHGLRLPMSAHPDDQAAYATPATRRDELLARWLCAPGDLWSAVSESHRCDLELDHLVDRPIKMEDSARGPSPVSTCVQPQPLRFQQACDTKASAQGDAPTVQISGNGSPATQTGGFRAAAGLARAASIAVVVLFTNRLTQRGY